jgi:hypothetical protein
VGIASLPAQNLYPSLLNKIEGDSRFRSVITHEKAGSFGAPPALASED